MQRLRTTSDIASVLIGNSKFTVAIDNGFGDGWTNVEIYDESEFNDAGWHFLTCVYGNFNVYDYDCCSPTKEHILTTVIARRTACYNDGNGRVALVTWRD